MGGTKRDDVYVAQGFTIGHDMGGGSSGEH